VTVKSLKPPLQIPLTVSLSDSVADLKAAVAAANPAAPLPDLQRLLLKGKTLADAKLLKEYDLADGAVINLLAKAAPPAPAPSQAAPSPVKGDTIAPARPTHLRAPSLTITTTDAMDIDAEFASDVSPEPPSPVSGASFHRTLSSPEFWHKVHALCQDEFRTEAEADTVFDNFLMSVKNRLTASETAKIRDEVGITGEFCAAARSWEQEPGRHC
jgi:UV excision repair protein RAD23